MKKLVAILMAALMLLCLCACGGSPDEGGNGGDGGSVVMPTAEPEFDVMPEKLELEKIMTLDAGSVSIYNGGIIYGAGIKKLGVAALDGSGMSEAKYAFCESQGNYFAVATKLPEDYSDISSLNCMGLVDGTGKVLIEEKYASIRVLSTQFVQVMTVDALTDSRSDALVYASDDMFSVMASDDDTFFSGRWWIIDLLTGKEVPGATGTQPYVPTTNGGYVTYVTDSQEKITVNGEGEPLPEGMVLLGNGVYRLDGAVYDANDEKLFNYDKAGFVPVNIARDYLYANKVENYKTTYAVMDYSGNIVSAVFDKNIQIYGSMIESGDAIYDFRGNQLADSTGDRVYFEDKLQNALLIQNGDAYRLLVNEGEELGVFDKKDGIYVDYKLFLMEKDGKYYCAKDAAFTLTAIREVGPWLVELDNEDGTRDLIYTYTGETILTGYEDYEYDSMCKTGFYIYAENTADQYEIFRIQ